MLSWRSRDSFLSIRSEGSVLSVGSIGSVASVGSIGSILSVENELPGVWLTPLLSEDSVVAAVGRTRQPTLLAGGTTDPHRRFPAVVGPGVEIVEVPGADHGLQGPDWRRSILDQTRLFDQIEDLAARVVSGSSTVQQRIAPPASPGRGPGPG